MSPKMHFHWKYLPMKMMNMRRSATAICSLQDEENNQETLQPLLLFTKANGEQFLSLHFMLSFRLLGFTRCFSFIVHFPFFFFHFSMEHLSFKVWSVSHTSSHPTEISLQEVSSKTSIISTKASPSSEGDNGSGDVNSRVYLAPEGQSNRNSCIFQLILLYAFICQRINNIQLLFMRKFRMVEWVESLFQDEINISQRNITGMSCTKYFPFLLWAFCRLFPFPPYSEVFHSSISKVTQFSVEVRIQAEQRVLCEFRFKWA